MGPMGGPCRNFSLAWLASAELGRTREKEAIFICLHSISALGDPARTKCSLQARPIWSNLLSFSTSSYAIFLCHSLYFFVPFYSSILLFVSFVFWSEKTIIFYSKFSQGQAVPCFGTVLGPPLSFLSLPPFLFGLPSFSLSPRPWLALPWNFCSVTRQGRGGVEWS